MWPRESEAHDGLLAVLAGVARSRALHHEAATHTATKVRT
jgi:hypothetical protein